MAETYFKKTARGYDTDAVDSFIVGLSDKYEKKERENGEKLARAESELKRAERETEECRRELARLNSAHESELAEKQKEKELLCAELGEKMLTADRRAAEIIKNAEREAAFIIEKAKSDAEIDSRAKSAKANEEAKRLIEATEKKCLEISEAAEVFRKKQSEMNASLSQTERSFGDALSKLKDGLE